MKFHNQKSFMGHEISNVTNKPLLHKKGKQWIVVAVSALILAGFGGVASTTIHADATNNGAQTESAASVQANSNSASSASSTQNQAKALHLNLLQNADGHKPSNFTTTNNDNVNNSNNSSKPTVHMMLTSSTPTITARGKWGDANWALDSNNTLSITGNGLKMNTSKASDASLSPDQQKSVNKIVVSGGVIAPVNANGLFGGDNSNVNHFNNVTVIDLSGLDTSNTTIMSNMFHGCGHLTNIYFKSPINGSTLFNTKKVSDMSSMFNDDCNIKSLDMSVFDTENVHNYNDMFWNTPNLTSLDLSNFVMNTSLPNFNVGGMFDMANGDVAGEPAGDNGTWETNHTRQYQCLRSLTLNSSFSKIDKNSACLNDAGIGTGGSSTTKNSDREQNNFNIYNLNRQTLSNDWSSLANSNSALDKGIDHNSTQTYNVYFTDKTPNETTPSTLDSTTVTDEKNASTINISEITFPKNTLNGYTINYAALPATGDTVPVKSDSHVDIPVFKESETLPSSPGKPAKTIKLVSDSGKWGSSNWILYPNGNLILSGGQLTNPDVEPTTVSSNLMSDASKVKKISTYGVSAPADDANLFGYFPNVTDLNLSGLIDHENNSDSARDLFSNSVRKITLGSDVTLNGGLQAYPESDSPSHDTDIADGAVHSNGQTPTTWIIDYAGTMNSEASADAQSAEDAANASASNTFTNASNSANNAWKWVSNNSANLSSASNSASDADKWIHSNSNSAQSADSWVSAQSSSVNSVVSSFNSVSNSAQSAYNYYSQSSASISSAVASLGSLNSAWTSASNAWSYVSSQSSSISTAITNASDAVNDYNSDTKSSLSTAYASANSAYTSLTSQKGSVQSAISRLNSMNNSFATLSNDISTDSANLSSAISNKADNSTLTADSSALNKAINSAQSWIKSNSASLNNASNEANEASNSANTNASHISSNSNSIASLSTSANTNSANASSSVKSLSSSAKTVESNNSANATSSVNSLSNSANAGISNNSSSITSLSSSAKTVESNNSADASSSVNSLSGSASKGIASNATRISNNSNNINTNSKIASNGIFNANASASASASVASSNAQSVANQNSASASISAANANSNADSYALSLAQNATGVANANAGGIDNTMSYDDQTVQSLSNTVNANTISLANNDNDLYQSKENKPATKKHGVKIAQLHQPLFYFYALKPLWLHTSAKFTKGNRAEELSAKHGYTLPITRIFKVNGALRFEVKIDGAKYFVTGNRYFARNAYIQPNEVKHNSSVKVLKAIREYKRAGFGKKNFIKGIRKGTVLPIKQAKTVANKQVTRLQLTNGHWITANKNLVKLI